MKPFVSSNRNIEKDRKRKFPRNTNDYTYKVSQNDETIKILNLHSSYSLWSITRARSRAVITHALLNRVSILGSNAMMLWSQKLQLIKF